MNKNISRSKIFSVRSSTLHGILSFEIVACKVYDLDWKYTFLKLNVYDLLTQSKRSVKYYLWYDRILLVRIIYLSNTEQDRLLYYTVKSIRSYTSRRSLRQPILWNRQNLLFAGASRQDRPNIRLKNGLG